MYVHEFALLVAIATPIAILCAIHAGLWAAGERETLMLPGIHTWTALAIEAQPAEMPAPQPTIPQNDEDFRLAA